MSARFLGYCLSFLISFFSYLSASYAQVGTLKPLVDTDLTIEDSQATTSSTNFSPTRQGVESIYQWSVDASEGKLVIRSPLQCFDSSTADCQSEGEIYVYDTSKGALTDTLNASDAHESDYFGYALDIDQEFLLVAAPDLTGEKTSAISSAVYLYDLSTQQPLRTFLHPSPQHAELDTFGWDVAIEGSNVLISDPLNNSVYLFNHNDGELLHIFTAEGNEFFGAVVKLNEGKALISAPGTPDGSSDEIHVYDIESRALLMVMLDPTNTAGSGFGSSLAVQGNIAAIESFTATDEMSDTSDLHVNQVHLYDLAGKSFIDTLSYPTPTLNEHHATCMALQENHLLIDISDACRQIGD